LKAREARRKVGRMGTDCKKTFAVGGKFVYGFALAG
jgi:hypothetical protein